MKMTKPFLRMQRYNGFVFKGVDTLQKKQSFVTGAAVLAAASVLCKLMSAVFKIPLDRFFLHEDGIAVYQSVCSVYNVFLAICVTGIPIALSGIIARSDDVSAADYCFTAFVFVSAFCAVSAVLLFAFAEPIALHLAGGGITPAACAIRASAPALLVMGVISSCRGYFQGRGNMMPSALSQLTESFMKAVLGIAICALLIGGGIEKGAMGAMAGVSAGAVCSAAVLLFLMKRQRLPRGRFSRKKAAEILKLSVPVTLGAFGFTAVMLTDTLTVTNILADCGFGITERLSLFGYLTRANTVYNLPATVITSVTASIFPVISSARMNGEKSAVAEQISRAIRLIFLVSLPCSFGLALFAPQIFLLLYSTGKHADLLILIGLLVLIMPYFQTTTGMLQAMDCVWKPIFACIGAVTVKLALNYILIPRIGIEGALASTVAAFAAAAAVNTVILKSVSLFDRCSVSIVKMLVCAAAACFSARLIYMLVPKIPVLIAAIVLAAALYSALVWLTGCISKEDILLIRK